MSELLPRKNAPVPARGWTDDHGEPLGDWVEISHEEAKALVREEGGLEALTVFSTLTDPDGTYGPPTIYTAWGRRGDPAPLIDATDLPKDEPGKTAYRKFVARSRTLAACSTCAGEGEVRFNPSRSVPKDPQLEDYATCPDCKGDGTQIRADLELLANAASTPSAGEYSFPRSCGWCGDEFLSRDEYWAHRLEHEEMLS